MKHKIKAGLFHLSKHTIAAIHYVLEIVLATTLVVSTAYTLYGMLKLAEYLNKPATIQIAVNDLTPYKTVKNNKDAKKKALLRLHVKNEDGKLGRFFCSGFVIDGQYALTAAHCLVDYRGRIKQGAVLVKDKHESLEITEAIPVAINNTRDVGLLRGDFSSFKSIPVDELGLDIFSSPNGSLLSCGWPSGSKRSACFPYYNKGAQFFSAEGDGFLFPGMSGGPVISLVSGKAVGINSAKSDSGYAIISTLTGLFADFEIEP